MTDRNASHSPPHLQDIDFEKSGGLVPVIVQDVNSQEVLMCGYSDQAAWEATCRSGYAHYYSRSRQRLWMKGEESGNRQKIREILIDCDNDTLLYRVEQEGDGACHTGNYSCFFRYWQDGSWQPR